MFPYPSGAGLHVGHPLGYIATDVFARFNRMRGKNVLHCLGYDAFGLPAEQYAVQTGQHPRKTTEDNIVIMARQLRRLGLGHDDRRAIETIDPEYYRWTQWIFLQIYNSWYDADAVRPDGGWAAPARSPSSSRSTESGRARCPPTTAAAGTTYSDVERAGILDGQRLAYTSEAPVNWCPGLGTVLSNEEVTNDGRSERGNFPVFKRNLRQWMMRITAYADRLADDLDRVDWPEKVRIMQRNWIGRSPGRARSRFPVSTTDGTRDRGLHDPARHPLRRDLHGAGARAPARRRAGAGRRLARGHQGRVDRRAPPPRRRPSRPTGARPRARTTSSGRPRARTRPACSPAAGRPTRSPATASRCSSPTTCSWATAPARSWPCPARTSATGSSRGRSSCRSSAPCSPPEATTRRRGVHRRGPGDQLAPTTELSLDGLGVADAKARIIDWLQDKGLGEPTVSYKLRDWLFSRQRYWGEPFPVVFDEDGIAHALPDVDAAGRAAGGARLQPKTYDPDDAAASPSRRCRASTSGSTSSWTSATARHAHATAARPTRCRTGPGRAGTTCATSTRPTTSAFVDPGNERVLDGSARQPVAGAPEGTRDPGGVDLYVGGVEHAVLHLLYARFWHKVLFDLGHLTSEEPFRTYFSQGYIQAAAFRDAAASTCRRRRSSEVDEAATADLHLAAASRSPASSARSASR